MWPQLHYLRSDATIENVDSYFDNELGNLLRYGVTPGLTWYDDELLGYLHPPQHLGMITVFDMSMDANSSTEVLGANTQSDPAWRLRIPREYLFVCAEMIDVQGMSFQEQRLSDRIIDIASQTVKVTE